MEILENILKAISIIWYAVTLYIKSIFAFWGIMFLLIIASHRNPFVELQKVSGNSFFTASIVYAFVIMFIFLEIKFILWVFGPERDSENITAVVIARRPSLGVAIKKEWNTDEKERKDGAIKESPKNKAE